jgi:phosphoglycerate dehydrogenase-like enzyme
MPDRSDRPLVIQTEHLDAHAAAWLAQRCRLEVCPDQDARFNSLLAQAEGLVIRTYTNIDSALLGRAPRLRCVARAGVGLDNVDVAACQSRGVTVVSTPGANTRAVVEYVFAMLLDALRPRMVLDRVLAGPEWKQARSGLIAPRQLEGMNLGVLGLGRVGSGIARVGRAFEMNVLYHDILELSGDRRAGATPVGLDELLRAADVLSIHVDGRASNRHIINARALALCKPGVLLVNTSRGFVIDNDALATFLRVNPGATALLDVHEPEPFDANYPLLGLPNARLSPHIAAATAAAHANMSWVVRDLWRVLCGETPEHPARA